MDESTAEETHVVQLIAIAELLLGAAYADDAVSWAERSAIGKALGDFVGAGQLPPPVLERVKRFDPEGFDPSTACDKLTLRTLRDRKELLALIARVTDADALLRPDEQAYIRQVAAAIGASEDELAEFIEAD